METVGVLQEEPINKAWIKYFAFLIFKQKILFLGHVTQINYGLQTATMLRKFEGCRKTTDKIWAGYLTWVSVRISGKCHWQSGGLLLASDCDGVHLSV